MQFHEAAGIFPLDEENIPKLAEDIRTQGLRTPIEIYKGKILDGRRRFIACEQLGIEPKQVEVNPDDPVAYVLSLNLYRRHLTASQASMVAARARGFFDERAKERQREGGKDHGKGHPKVVANLPQPKQSRKSRDDAAAAVGVGGRTVDYASKVLKNGTPELIQAVDTGKMKVSAAAKLAEEPKKVQREVLESGRKVTQDGVEPEEGKPRGVGIYRANEAIACLKRIPKNDGLRKRGFQIVTDWIKQNK